MVSALPPRPPTAHRIAEARERLGLAHADLATRLGINLASYWDLEVHDDEAFVTLSLRQLCALADALRVSVRDLVSEDAAAVVPPDVSPNDLVEAIARRIEQDRSNVDALGEELGWELTAVLNDPNRIWDDWCVDGLRDVCDGLGLDWRSVLPDRRWPLSSPPMERHD